jgi:hypothetical protein
METTAEYVIDKTLSPAEKRHLQTLNQAVMFAQQQLTQFIAFLRDQHDAPEMEWSLERIEVGFVKVENPSYLPREANEDQRAEAAKAAAEVAKTAMKARQPKRTEA